MKRPKIGFFSLSCCGGCLMQTLLEEESFIKLGEIVDIVQFRLIKDSIPETEIDIAVIEGSIGSKEDRAKAEEIRKAAKQVIALGACAIEGGVQSKEGFLPLRKAIKIDWDIRGCPVDAGEFLQKIAALLVGQDISQRELSVCSECREKEFPCLINRGSICLGFLSYAGCGAACPSKGTWCLGCRGFMKESNKGMANEISGKNISHLMDFFGEEDGRD